MIAAPRSAAFGGNQQAQAALGISPRKLTVLQEVATARSNIGIEARLVSPNTVKTHVARLFAKLRAMRAANFRRSRFRKILSYGTAAGLIVGALLSFQALGTNHPTSSSYGMVIGYLTMLVGLSAVFMAIKRHRDADLGGVIKFWPAFGLGLGISIVAGVGIYARGFGR